MPVRSRGIGAWILGAALTVYLGIQGGGYDVVIRSPIGMAAWWAVLLGLLVGLPPAGRIGRASWTAFGLLTAFAVWTGLSALWGESSERSVAEAGRLVTYLGLFALAVTVCSRERARPLLGGVAAGIVAVACLAILSRLHPSWLPADAAVTGDYLPSARSRLAYPLNYWNALAALTGLGLPLVLAFATAGRSAGVRCAATTAIPLIGFCTYLTLSRGGALATAAGCLAFLAFTPRRTRALTVLLLGAGASAILIAGVRQRAELAGGLDSELARTQGGEQLMLLLCVCLGVALLHAGAGMSGRHWLTFTPRVVHPSRRARVAAMVAGTVVVAALALAAAPGMADRWETFKNPQVGEALSENRTAARFTSASGNGRYQFWRSAIDGFESRPLTGIGAGAFEFWWARHATLPGFVRNAHSLYFETLAETGLVGLCMLLGLFGTVIAGGARSLRRTHGDERTLLAGALAGCCAFFVSASVDWVWQIAVVPVCFLLLAAALLTSRASSAGRSDVPLPAWPRVGLGAAAAAALVTLAIPLSGAVALRDSQEAARDGDVTGAAASASVATRLLPYAASPALQSALVHELRRDLAAASASARAAQRLEPTNWRASYALARIETRRGRVREALDALRRARSLNRTSTAIR